MAKNITIKIIKAFEIKKDTKYILVLPHYLGNDPAVGKALYKIFQDANSEFVGLMIKEPNDVKILEVPQKDVGGKSESGKKE